MMPMFTRRLKVPNQSFFLFGLRIPSIEVKAAERYRSEDARALRDVAQHLGKTTSLVVYLGSRPLKDNGVDVLPIGSFLRRLARGNVLG